MIEDRASTNGTLVNKQRIIRHELKPSDQITLGRCTLVFAEVEAKDFHLKRNRGWFRLLKRSETIVLSPPRGSYVLPVDDIVIEFDAISYSMVQDHQSTNEETKKDRTVYLRRYPRLQVAAKDAAKRSEEVTRFYVPESVFRGMETLDFEAPLVFAQPEVRRSRFRIPWVSVEWAIVPAIFIVLLVLFGKQLLTYHIDSEFKKAEGIWNERLTLVAEQYRARSASTLSIPIRKAQRKKITDASLPLTEFWKEIDASMDLRNFILFRILDELLTEQAMEWSLDEALANLHRIDSVTARLPSVKRLSVVLNTEGPPMDISGLTSSKLMILAQLQEKQSTTEAYVAYKNRLGPRLAVVSSCAAARKEAIRAGRVVLAFTVAATGRLRSVFINEERSTQEATLWSCVKNKLSQIRLDPPPENKPISIVYSFNFAPPKKIQF